MIILEEGSREMMPWVRVEITTGRFWFEWWFEVSYWDEKHRENDQRCPCWVHYYQKDGGGFGLWFVLRKAQEVLMDVWMELTDNASVPSASSSK